MSPIGTDIKQSKCFLFVGAFSFAVVILVLADGWVLSSKFWDLGVPWVCLGG